MAGSAPRHAARRHSGFSAGGASAPPFADYRSGVSCGGIRRRSPGFREVPNKRGLAARRKPGAKTRNSGKPKTRENAVAGFAPRHAKPRTHHLRPRRWGEPSGRADWKLATLELATMETGNIRQMLPVCECCQWPIPIANAVQPCRRAAARRHFGFSAGGASAPPFARRGCPPEFDFPIGIWENRRR